MSSSSATASSSSVTASSSSATETTASLPPSPTSSQTTESSSSITNSSTSSHGMSTSSSSTSTTLTSFSTSSTTPSQSMSSSSQTSNSPSSQSSITSSSSTTSSSTSSTTTSSTSSTTTSTTSSTTSSTTTSPPSSSTSSTSSTTSADPSTPSTSLTSSTTLAIVSTTTIRTLPVTTLQNTVFITTTDNRGLVTTTALSSFTSIITSTASNGSIMTVTEVQVNPTLNSNNKAESSSSQFFSNTGAVAGTFILVGLTATSLLLWFFFFVRRRRRRRWIEHNSAVSATLAAAGLYRTPLDDDEPRHGASPEVEMNERGSSRIGLQSQPSNGRMSNYFDAAEPDNADPFNPYAEFGVPSGNKDGYEPARASSPDEHYRDRQGSTSTAGFVVGHSASGSYEPLLASYYRQSAASPPSPTVPLDPLPRNTEQNKEEVPPRESEKSSSVYDSEDTDNRLDPNIHQRLGGSGGGDNASAKEPRDEEDYSRPVLLVRNLPDASSRES